MPEFSENRAVILACRRFGEHAFIVSLLTAEHGRLAGLYKNRRAPEPGTVVSARWRARLSEQLGTFYLEEVTPLASLYLDDPGRLACLASACALLNDVLPERQAYGNLFIALTELLTDLGKDDFLKRYVLFEKTVLAEIGFGLDTSGCAGGGSADDLAYISPKTGRAVSREKGQPYHDKLLKLPPFLWREAPADSDDIRQGLILTGFFLALHTPRHRLPISRESLLNR